MKQEKNNRLDLPVRYLKGVGPRRDSLLAKVGILKAEDLLYYLPARYEDRSRFVSIKDIRIGEYQTVRGRIITLNSRLSRTGASMVQIAVTDDSGIIHAIWFNQPYLKDVFIRGQDIVLYGKTERYDKLEIVQPEYEILRGDERDSINIGRIVPVYPTTEKLSQRYLRGLIYSAVMSRGQRFPERLPTYIRARHRLADATFAIRNIHFPANFESLGRAYRRIVFEEFFILQLALALKRRGMKAVAEGQAHALGGKLMEDFHANLKFELTTAQKKAIADIERDMSSARPMSRLLEGEVGSGKTIVAAHALTLTVGNGFQGVIMAPTEILARQHFMFLSEFLMPLGINVVLLLGGCDPKTRERLYGEIRTGTAQVVVGTHAVIQENVEFKRLGLAVIDEQHKFGVSQRQALKRKGQNPHILIMTATPIPRTLALTVYGDLDISAIRELPKGRGSISTYWVEEEKRSCAYDFIKEQVREGRQAYVVCPAIEKGMGAKETFERLKNEVFAEFTVELLHGKMGSKEKDAVMRDFKKARIDVLVSTIVIEVGIDVPNASVMLVENADRFGLATLHQLRGRVGRGEHRSYCVLLADPKTAEAVQRLKSIEETLDGFEIAQADLEIRGPGEFLGTRQHGLPEIRFGDIVKDLGIMEEARKEAFDLILSDPGFSDERHALLREELATRFKEFPCA